MTKKKTPNNLSLDEFSFEKYGTLETPRPQQLEVIPKIIEAFKTKKFFILEAPTGSGKSMIATTLCNYYSQKDSRTTILVHQKVLQEQYQNEKWKDIELHNVTSSTNYICTRFKSLGLTCSQISKIKSHKNSCAGGCPYVRDRNNFVTAPIGLTNMQFFLNFVLQYKLEHFQREFMVVDEAHSIEDQFLNFISVDISEEVLGNKMKLIVPKERFGVKTCLKYIDEELKPKVLDFENDYFKKSQELQDKEDEPNRMKFTKFMNEYSYFLKYRQKLESLTQNYNSDTWAFDIEQTEKGRRFSFKPIMIDKYTNQSLFSRANKFLLMSATILGAERFCENIGINQKDGVEFLSLPSKFPLDIRPIFYFNSGRMGQDNIQKTLPNMTKDVEKIMTKHKNEKGVIFCHTYRIGDYIKEHVNGKNGERLLFHSSKNRQAILDYHLESEEPTVLLTPSLSEGIDLKHDLSRFQILCKLPFPYLGDERVQKKMKKFEWWYGYKTVKSVVQSLGRSVRSEDDWAYSYILDGDWGLFYKRNEELFPLWMREAMTNDIQKLMFLF